MNITDDDRAEAEPLEADPEERAARHYRLAPIRGRQPESPRRRTRRSTPQGRRSGEITPSQEAEITMYVALTDR